MTDVLPFRRRSRPESDKSAVALAERLLERVIAGEITDFACATIYADGNVGCMASATEQRTKLLGAVMEMIMDLRD